VGKTKTGKLFIHGRSQAVRLPKEACPERRSG
jgi:virulence-associated protein VagC